MNAEGYRPVPVDLHRELEQARKRIVQLEREQPMNKVARIAALQITFMAGAAVLGFVVACVISVCGTAGFTILGLALGTTMAIIAYVLANARQYLNNG